MKHAFDAKDGAAAFLAGAASAIAAPPVGAATPETLAQRPIPDLGPQRADDRQPPAPKRR